jgi:hypothetical protein
MTQRPYRSSVARAAFTTVVALACAGSLHAAPSGCSGRPAAKLEEVLGQVSLMKDGRVDIPLDLANHNQVCATQKVVTGPASFAKFRLQDNSTFEVYENSTVEFKSDWPSWTYLLNLVMGHVKVFIDHSKGPNNNSVMTPTAVISVRGTVFDVTVVDNDGTTDVVCDEGLVQVKNVTAPGTEPLLRPGEWIRIFPGQGLMGKAGLNGQQQQFALKAARTAIDVLIRKIAGGSGPGGGAPGTSGTGAQGDKSKGGAAPPPLPGNGH